LSAEEVEDIKEMFKKIDADNDGIVLVDELKAGLLKFGSPLAESEVQMLIETVSLSCLQAILFHVNLSPFLGLYPVCESRSFSFLQILSSR